MPMARIPVLKCAYTVLLMLVACPAVDAWLAMLNETTAVSGGAETVACPDA